MARTKDQILQVLIDKKNANAILAAILTSESKAAFWYNLFDLYASVTGDFELTFDAFKAELETLLDSKQVHTPTWWRVFSLRFQLGDALVTQPNGNLAYAVVDTDKQIVKRAAIITQANGRIDLKVAKLDSNEIPVPLTSSELSAFTSYVNDGGPAGIIPTITSTDADELRPALAVIIDSAIINVDDGTLLSDGTTKPVQKAIFDHLATFQDTDFGGEFFASNMLSDIVRAQGVISATYTTLTKKSAGDANFVNVLTLSGQKFQTVAGHLRVEAAWDLDINITYTAG